MLKIAIIGRPNVGKSTLFNKLVGKKFAITDDVAGVTRDRKEAMARLGDIDFIAIDTAGLENEIKGNVLTQKMVEQTNLAIIDADLCLFVVDGREGVVAKDQHFARWLHKIGKKTLLVVNKCENSAKDGWNNSYFGLGFGEPVGISAEHNLGFGDLYEKILPIYEQILPVDIENTENETNTPLQIAIIGRPNVGKSTLLNKILQQDRMITSDIAGTTRDSIAIDHEFKGQKIRFIDTAGIRRKASIDNSLEKLSVADSFRALRFAQVAILMIDANYAMDKQDMALAGEVLKEGRALLFAINKIDIVKGDKEVFMRQIRAQLQQLFAEIDGACILGISAKSGYNIEKLLDFALQTYQQWQVRITTSKLNEWLRSAESYHGPKLYKGKETKLKYITQIKMRPPTFTLFTNNIKAIEGDYQRYLANSLRKTFGLTLTPIRLFIKKSQNPYTSSR
ncbi:MAG TPA: ribosome biogenesis GTPase Der [Rickettsiales bacterium]|nr:ribosome biogenesis GTPase Der [Rickettsiales bacterium]